MFCERQRRHGGRNGEKRGWWGEAVAGSRRANVPVDALSASQTASHGIGGREAARHGTQVALYSRVPQEAACAPP